MGERYKVLIADDEYWTREKLRKMIEWDEYELELLPLASDGEEVLARMEQHRPDILITDINMPFLNGVELLEEVQKLYPDVITFVISGYNDFEYVKGAFLAGSINYLMKPVSKIDLVNAIIKALEIIQERRSLKAQEAKKKLEFSKAASLMQDREFSQLLEHKDMLSVPYAASFGLDAAGLSLTLIKIHNMSYLMKECGYDMNLISVKTKNRIRDVIGAGALMVFNYIYRSNEFLIVSEIERETLVPLIKRLLEELCGWTQSVITIVTSSHIYSLDNIQQAYVQAISLLMTRKFTSESCLITANPDNQAGGGEVNSRFSEIQAKELRTLLKSGNQRGIYELVFEKTGIRKCKEEAWSYLEVRQTVKRVCNILSEEAEKALSPEELLQAESMAEMADKAVELLDDVYLCEVTETMIDSVLAAGTDDAADTMQETVRQAAVYVDEHYFETLTLSGLSEQFHVEHSYFSKLFKKLTGETLMMYIAKLRIRKAKEYMKENAGSLTEIAFMVGYDDYTYFNKVFRKLTGVSPRDYKKSLELAGF